MEKTTQERAGVQSLFKNIRLFGYSCVHSLLPDFYLRDLFSVPLRLCGGFSFSPEKLGLFCPIPDTSPVFSIIWWLCFRKNKMSISLDPESLIDRAVARSISLNLKDIPGLLGTAAVHFLLPTLAEFLTGLTADLRPEYKIQHLLNV